MIGLYDEPKASLVTRNTGSLAISSVPAVEPITAADAKLYCRVDGSTDDGLFASLITAARRAVEAYTGRVLITQTWDWFLDDAPRRILEVPLPPLASVSGIYFTDEDDTEGSAISSSLYVVDTARNRICLKDGESWGYTSLRSFKSTRVRFVAGYGATAADVAAGTPIVGSVPADVLAAIRRTILAAYERDAAIAGPEDLPAEAKAFLRSYMVPRC